MLVEPEVDASSVSSWKGAIVSRVSVLRKLVGCDVSNASCENCEVFFVKLCHHLCCLPPTISTSQEARELVKISIVWVRQKTNKIAIRLVSGLVSQR